MRRGLLILAVCLGVAAANAAGDAQAAKLGERCGGFVGIPCESGLWCEMPARRCQAADMFGTCVKRSEICYQIYRPECGCDGKTYGNDCERRRARVSKDHDGKC